MILHRVPAAACGLVLLAATGCAGHGAVSSQPAPGGSTPTNKPTGSTSRSPNPQPVNPPATEYNPPGDIPDSQVYVAFRVPGSSVRIRVPEGWSRSTSGGTSTFGDHYNSVAIEVHAAGSAPTVGAARASEVPALRRSVSAFSPTGVTEVRRQHGRAVLITYLLDSKPNTVTGKVVRDAAERFEFWSHGQEAVLTLTGPQNADNVDPWRLVSDSLQWR